jgi:hypothetical protein
MNSARKIAIIVGTLFILATAFSLISSALVKSPLDASDYLVKVSENENQVIIAALLLLASALSVVLIPAMIFPILKRHDEGRALGYFGLRIIEAITQIVSAVSFLLLVTLSREYVASGAPLASYFQTSGAVLKGAHNWAFPLNPIVFGLGALIFYHLLYQSRLIPQWLSAWGLIGAILVFAAGLQGMFGDFPTILALPIAVQEYVMAIWLIVKGFNPSAIASKSPSVSR